MVQSSSTSNQSIVDDIITFLEIPMGNVTQFGHMIQKRVIIQSQSMLIQHSVNGQYHLGVLDILKFNPDYIKTTNIETLKQLLSKILEIQVPILAHDVSFYLSVIPDIRENPHFLPDHNWVHTFEFQNFYGYPYTTYHCSLKLHDSVQNIGIVRPYW